MTFDPSAASTTMWPSVSAPPGLVESRRWLATKRGVPVEALDVAEQDFCYTALLLTKP